ncbi:MAG TPA: histidine kinase [Aquificales bacterium]|uniref:histidine kinase n=1 Tax=Aquifex aeolicus TaxID=63363 RepID=A0A9D1CFL9_AQUAO|nr:histidine kinase [Aquificales bacterium]HIP98576.1 histidine kinase [Aquifex aeolicus]
MLDLFKRIVDRSPYGVIVVEKHQGKILYTNPILHEWGISERELLKFLLQENPSEVELKNRFFKITKFEEDGNIIFLIEEITPLKTYQRAKKDFVANVSHELKTPISVISSIAETLYLEEKYPFKKRFLERILKRTKEMEALVEDLLILAALESKEGKVIWEDINLKKLAEEVVQNLKEFTDEKNVTIKVEIPDNFRCRCDGHKISILLKNLVENAIKYNREGGQVWIKAYRSGKYTVLEVSDTGIGIPKKHLPFIFERFYRVDKSRSREIRGTGLGLSIVKHIALIHGGKVEVESQPGNGSTFRILIPQ